MENDRKGMAQSRQLISNELVAQFSTSMLSHTAEQCNLQLPLDPENDHYTIPESFLPKANTRSRICGSCRAATSAALNSEQGFLHSSDVLCMENRSRSCDLCFLIQRQICHAIKYQCGNQTVPEGIREAVDQFGAYMKTQNLQLQLPISLVLRTEPCEGMFGRLVSIVPILRLNHRAAHGRWGRLLLHVDEEGMQSPLWPRGSEADILDRLAAWLRQRNREVPAWSDTGQENPPPTRVLDLQAFGDHDWDIKLVESTGMKGYFVTLSYCWGGYTECRLLQANHHERLDRIRLADLPPVFAQAVRVTRALGVRYLWIDALCIIQDDTEDWRREAACMSDIYWNAQCRLAVNDCKSPLESFFPPKDVIASVSIPAGKAIGGEGKQTASSSSQDLDASTNWAVTKSELPSAYLTAVRSYSIDVDRGCLNKRAWVLQERLLSPRTIHFTTEHIYCEDQDEICGEDWIRSHFSWLSSIDKDSDFTRIQLFSEESYRSRKKGFPGVPGDIWFLRSSYKHDNLDEFPDPWLRIPEIFSQCQLSFQTDRLAAIAGLIKRKGTSFGSARGRNLLGIWERELHIELAWVGRKRRFRHLEELKLPSWTWLSYNGPINFVLDRRSIRDMRTVRERPYPALEVVDIDVPDITAPLPLTPPAVLKTRTSVRIIHTVSEEVSKYGQTEKTREELAAASPFYFNPASSTEPIALTERTDCHAVLDERSRIIGFLAFDEEFSTKSDLHCLHLSTLRDADRPILAYVLVVRQVDGAENRYRRVGFAEVNYEWMIAGKTTIVDLV